MKAILFLLFVSLALRGMGQPQGLPVQPFSLSYGKMIDWYSPVVKDSFRTYVFLPPGYDTSSAAYPVLYLTDGDWQFTTAVSSLGNLKIDYKMREPIIVAVGYGDRENKRGRDLDPDVGGAAFLRAVKEEVMPWVNQQFRATEEKYLYGYSMGSKFATFALFSEPQLFSSVMIGAPADGGTHLVPTANKFSQHLSNIHSKVFIAAGSYEHETVDHIAKFRAWCKINVPNATITTYTAPQMNHGAAISAVLQEALRVNFATLKKEIKISPAILQRYAGVYRMVSDTSVSSRVFVSAGKLYIMLQGYEKKYPLELHATAANQFFLKEFERNTYRFDGLLLKIYLPDGRVLEMSKK